MQERERGRERTGMRLPIFESRVACPSVDGTRDLERCLGCAALKEIGRDGTVVCRATAHRTWESLSDASTSSYPRVLPLI
jgi:hypothetical protein